MKKINFHITKDASEVTCDLYAFFDRIHSTFDKKDYVLPGGSTPRRFYSFLATKVDNWSKTRIVLSDERLVGQESKLSNISNLKKYLLENIDSEKNLPEIIETASIDLYKTFIPSLTILGLGEDGHTASLFPHDRNIFALPPSQNLYRTKRVNENFDRFTLTFAFLLKSRNLAILVKGKEKSKILKTVINENYDPVRYPVQYLLNQYHGNVEIFCDESAYGVIA